MINPQILANLLALAAVCPFVGSLSDLLGRRYVALLGASLLIIGMIVSSTANDMNNFIGKQLYCSVDSACSTAAFAAARATTPRNVTVSATWTCLATKANMYPPESRSSLVLSATACHKGPTVTSLCLSPFHSISLAMVGPYKPIANSHLAGMAIAGAGAGINELTALAATSEMAPTSKRGKYVAVLIFTIIPFSPSVLWGQLIASNAGWRYIGLLCGVWAAVGFLLTLIFYFPPPRVNSSGLTRSELLARIDYVGGFLSIVGLILFMCAMQWGGYMVSTLPASPVARALF